MADGTERAADLQVLRNKRDATRYRILVQIAERQPAVSQSEIADTLGITSQAVSQYLTDLEERRHVEKLGRGRYEITAEGVDWLLTQTDDLQEFTRYVAEEVIEQAEVETAIAREPIEAGASVSLTLDDGIIHATPGDDGAATATAVTDAEAGRDVGLTDMQGLLDYDLGQVTVVVVPGVQDGGSRTIDETTVADLAGRHDLLAVTGTEALALARAAELTPDLRFGTPEAVQEAAVKGLDVLMLAVPDTLSTHLDRLREYDIAYEVVDDSDQA